MQIGISTYYSEEGCFALTEQQPHFCSTGLVCLPTFISQLIKASSEVQLRVIRNARQPDLTSTRNLERNIDNPYGG